MKNEQNIKNNVLFVFFNLKIIDNKVKKMLQYFRCSVVYEKSRKFVFFIKHLILIILFREEMTLYEKKNLLRFYSFNLFTFFFMWNDFGFNDGENYWY